MVGCDKRDIQTKDESENDKIASKHDPSTRSRAHDKSADKPDPRDVHTLGPASRPHEPRVASTPENCEEDEDDEEEEAKEEDKEEEENVEPLTLLTLLTLLLLLRTNTQTHIQTHTNTYTHNIAAAGAEDADEDVCTTTASGPQRHVSQSPVRQRAAGEGTSLSRWGQRAACKGTSLSRWSCGQDELWLWLAGFELEL